MRVASVIGWALAAMAVTTTTPGGFALQDTDSTGTSDVFDVRTYMSPQVFAPNAFGAYSITNHHPSLAASVHFEVFVTFEYGGMSWHQQLARSHVTLAPGQGIVSPPVGFLVANGLYPGVLACRASATFQGDPLLRAFAADFSPFMVLPLPPDPCAPPGIGCNT